MARVEKLTERLVPPFDDTGPPFVASDNPVPEDQDFLPPRGRSDSAANALRD